MENAPNLVLESHIISCKVLGLAIHPFNIGVHLGTFSATRWIALKSMSLCIGIHVPKPLLKDLKLVHQWNGEILIVWMEFFSRLIEKLPRISSMLQTGIEIRQCPVKVMEVA